MNLHSFKLSHFPFLEAFFLPLMGSVFYASYPDTASFGSWCSLSFTDPSSAFDHYCHNGRTHCSMFILCVSHGLSSARPFFYVTQIFFRPESKVVPYRLNMFLPNWRNFTHISRFWIFWKNIGNFVSISFSLLWSSNLVELSHCCLCMGFPASNLLQSPPLCYSLPRPLYVFIYASLAPIGIFKHEHISYFSEKRNTILIFPQICFHIISNLCLQVLLLLPYQLIFLNLPNCGFSPCIFTEGCLCRVASELAAQSSLRWCILPLFRYLCLLPFRIPCLTTFFGAPSSVFSLDLCPTKLTYIFSLLCTPSIILFT